MLLLLATSFAKGVAVLVMHTTFSTLAILCTIARALPSSRGCKGSNSRAYTAGIILLAGMARHVHQSPN